VEQSGLGGGRVAEKDIDMHKNVILFMPPVLIFTKLTNAKQHYVKIPCTKFYPNLIINMESMDINSFMPMGKVWLSL
jgi:hypothetical protein